MVSRILATIPRLTAGLIRCEKTKPAILLPNEGNSRGEYTLIFYRFFIDFFNTQYKSMVLGPHSNPDKYV